MATPFTPLQSEMERDVMEVDGYLPRVLTWPADGGQNYEATSSGFSNAVLIDSEGNPIEVERSVRVPMRLFGNGEGPFPQSGELVIYTTGEAVEFFSPRYKIVRVRITKQVFLWLDLISATR